MSVRDSRSGFLPAAAAAFSALVASLPVGAQQTGDAAPLALRCGRIIDVVSGRTTAGATILVRGERIESISNRDAPSGARVVDLSSMTCLPGLIDLHTHIVINPDTLSGSDLDRSSADRALDGLHNAQLMLRAGFTTLRDPGRSTGTSLPLLFATRSSPARLSGRGCSWRHT